MSGHLDHRALHGLSYGVFIITSCAGERLNGCIVNTVFQVTSKPPRVAVAINRGSLTHEMIVENGVFAVSILGEKTPLKFIGVFGFNTGRTIDKFTHASSKKGITGCPLVTEHSIAVFEARVLERIDLGTHTVFLAEVVSGEVVGPGKPLTYAFYREHKKGKTPKSAPTYRAMMEEEGKKTTKGRREMNNYICNVCGYIYDPAAGDPDNGVDPGTPFDKLPDDWVCPVCGAGKDQFSPQS